MKSEIQGDILMKQLLLLVAVVGLATTGCASSGLMGPSYRQAGGGISSPGGSSVQTCSTGGGCDDACCGDSSCDSCCGGGCSDGCCGDGGCSSGRCGRGGGGCSACGGSGCGLCQRMVGRVASGFCPHSGGYPEAYNDYTPSPPSGQVAYPYYTTRGPRDFLSSNPPSIGPY